MNSDRAELCKDSSERELLPSSLCPTRFVRDGFLSLSLSLVSRRKEDCVFMCSMSQQSAAGHRKR